MGANATFPLERFICLVAAITWFVLWPCNAYADLYKWVDENGKVHYSDKPSSTGNVTQQKAPIRDIKARTSYSVKQVTPLAVIKADGQPSRSVQLESIVLRHTPHGKEENRNRIYYGKNCRKHHNWFMQSDQKIHAQQAPDSYKKLADRFASVFSEAGYATEKVNDNLFSGQKFKAPELSFAAIVEDVRLSGCDHYSKTQAKYAAYMKVRWQVFDNLMREIVFEDTTQGSYSGTFASDSRNRYPSKENWKVAFGNAFGATASNLLANPSLSSILLDKPSLIVSDTKPLNLNVNYGNRDKQFLDQLPQLKSSAVTIRSTDGHGSGFIITQSGHILTNAHVVAGADRVIILLDGEELIGSVVRRDKKRDIALIKLDEKRPVVPAIISRQEITEGANIYVIGTPLKENFGHSVTRGIISAKRKGDDGQHYLQTDAAINPGNSGGPVFDDNGEVVAVTVSGYFSQAGGALNVNFLIPIEDALTALGINEE